MKGEIEKILESISSIGELQALQIKVSREDLLKFNDEIRHLNGGVDLTFSPFGGAVSFTFPKQDNKTVMLEYE